MNNYNFCFLAAIWDIAFLVKFDFIIWLKYQLIMETFWQLWLVNETPVWGFWVRDKFYQKSINPILMHEGHLLLIV